MDKILLTLLKLYEIKEADRDSVVKYLDKEIRGVALSIERTTTKPNRTQKEMDDLQKKLSVLTTLRQVYLESLNNKVTENA